VQDVGVGEPGGQGGSGDIARQCRQGAIQRIGREIVLGEIGVDHAGEFAVLGAQLP
jgi:hypothetical protein